MNASRELLDQLDALHAVATTSEPWINDSHELYREMPGLPGITGITGTWIGETCDIDNLPGSEANATLIAAAVNALPQLTAALRELADLADSYPLGTDVPVYRLHRILAALSPAHPMSAEPGMSQP